MLTLSPLYTHVPVSISLVSMPVCFAYSATGTLSIWLRPIRVPSTVAEMKKGRALQSASVKVELLPTVRDSTPKSFVVADLRSEQMAFPLESVIAISTVTVSSARGSPVALSSRET